MRETTVIRQHCITVVSPAKKCPAEQAVREQLLCTMVTLKTKVLNYSRSTTLEQCCNWLQTCRILIDRWIRVACLHCAERAPVWGGWIQHANTRGPEMFLLLPKRESGMLPWSFPSYCSNNNKEPASRPAALTDLELGPCVPSGAFCCRWVHHPSDPAAPALQLCKSIV